MIGQFLVLQNLYSREREYRVIRKIKGRQFLLGSYADYNEAMRECAEAEAKAKRLAKAQRGS